MNSMHHTPATCAACGLPLPSDAPAGLCPACLLQTQTALTSPDSPAPPPTPSPGPRPIPGHTFAGYRIERLLGRGGMGEVYEAEDLATGRRVALKVMSHALASDEDRKRFLREGRLAASVNHPNVVYIHGSEDIDGTPVIAMELVREGTLKDRLRQQGPLPVTEAVHLALQIIAGLEAAHARGVLHRDIKPANCFLAHDGTVKIGDFGLSVSTLARGESLLTATGAVLGTPTYASPEQLRGEELNVTSDLYSVGATLYHLLTGRPPFTSTDFVKLITEVLDRPPESPQSLRSEIPAELSAIVLRCLAKTRQTRFRNYAELRDALLPFAGVPSTPANRGARFLAGLLDETVAHVPTIAFALWFGLVPLDHFANHRTAPAFLTWLAIALGLVAYYAVSEGLWGAAFGKSLLGLRVVGPDGSLPGLPRATLRAILWLLPAQLPGFLLLATHSLPDLQTARADGALVWTDDLELVLFLGLFITMRARNGYAGVHDLLSKTRVVRRPRSSRRPTCPASPPPHPDLPPWPVPGYGPYTVRGCLWQTGPAALLEASDLTLRRRVWIEIQPATSHPSPPARPELSRPTRLRWLQSGTHDQTTWTVYEAPDGSALLDLLQHPQPWDAVRFWLLDLAQELDALQRQAFDHPTCSLDRIWITQSGRALLLDFPAPTHSPRPLTSPAKAAEHAAPPPPLSDHPAWPIDPPSSAQAFLDHLGRRTLEGPHPTSNPPAEPHAPVPLDARTFLGSLARRSFERLEYVIGNLESLTQRQATVSRNRRALSLTVLPLTAGTLALLLAIGLSFDTLRWQRAWSQTFPGRPSLRAAADEYVHAMASIENGLRPEREALQARAYLVHHYADILTNDVFWTNAVLTDVMSPMERDLLKAVTLAPAPPADLLEEANRTLPPRLRQRELAARIDPLYAALAVLLFSPLPFAGLELAGALWSGRSWLLAVFSLALVDRTGRPARRPRLLARWTLVWIPLLFTATLGGISTVTLLDGAFVHYLRSGQLAPLAAYPGLACLCLSTLLGLASLQAIRRPDRSLPDRLAGTRLVPQ